MSQVDPNKRFNVHPPIFGKNDPIKRSRAYCLFVAWFFLGLILGGSPLLEGMTPSALLGEALTGTAAQPRRPVGPSVNFEKAVSQRDPISSFLRTSHANGGIGGVSRENSAAMHRPRLLFMAATYTMDQLRALQMTLDGMRDICNAGWNVTIHLQSASDLVYGHERYEEFRRRLWCEDARHFIPLIVEHYDKVGFGLNSRHRLYMREHVRDFDYFSFAEEDMLLTVSHLRAYVAFERHMRAVLPRTHLRYTIGFLRYEDSTIDTERVLWEYIPSLIHVADMGPRIGQFIVTNNLNQAIYILSQEQVVDLENRCGFLTDIGQSAFYREMRKAMNKDL
jgi:hypothetical protein